MENMCIAFLIISQNKIEGGGGGGVRASQPRAGLPSVLALYSIDVVQSLGMASSYTRVRDTTASVTELASPAS